MCGDRRSPHIDCRDCRLLSGIGGTSTRPFPVLQIWKLECVGIVDPHISTTVSFAYFRRARSRFQLHGIGSLKRGRRPLSDSSVKLIKACEAPAGEETSMGARGDRRSPRSNGEYSRQDFLRRVSALRARSDRMRGDCRSPRT